MLGCGALLGLWALLLDPAWGEPLPETLCPRGLSWSPDLEKCMDCAMCQTHNKNDFCSTCGAPQPPDTLNWWILLGASVGAVFVGFVVIGGIIYYARCRRREKFTTPIEETGGHSAQESLID
ncbi:tumor necrosis factor receptor superfamily member 12A [Sphaerodactylus townsendi]|uniref:Uncharacterized protein n=1 Tax=Sphaerodactylus townsendi TaxID=933632 RepID=A0ACB8EW60_9SAUR|nr:tumor necrosis factor receptor superfamily member 12A [Sphaerodactylus townsendi]